MQDVLYRQAIQFYQSRNLTEAEKIFRRILTDDPHHANSLHILGLIAFDVGRYDIAEELVRAALIEQNNAPSFYFTLGRILIKQDKKEEAVTSYRQAIYLKADFTDALNNLGTALMSLGREDEASEIFTKLLKENPKNFNALCNTASISYNKKEYQQSIDLYRTALTIDPRNANLHYDIGRALKLQNKITEALINFKQASEYKPDHIEALLNIGNIYRETGQLEKALHYYTQVKGILPHEDAYANITRIYLQENRYEEAIVEAKTAVEMLPDSVQSLNNLGIVYDTISKFQEALECYERALLLDPNKGETFAFMGGTLKSLGFTEESIQAQKKALELLPNTPWVYSNLLLTMVYTASVPPEELAAVSRQFGELIADRYHRTKHFTNDKSLDRKLRIGYVSPDFKDHAVHYFLSPVYKRDKNQFEIFAYSKVEKEDIFTDRIKKEFDHWRDIRFLDDDVAADLIEADKIDILVDLAGHTGHNGLMTFARKPAPIQVTWLGHPATTGMKAIDYRITDSYAEPVGMTEHLNTEKLWRLPQIFCAYSPSEKSPPVIDHPPFEDNGYITFGCFNNFTKVTDDVLRTWAAILTQIPDARILIEIPGINNQDIKSKIETRLKKCGLPLERTVLEPRKKTNHLVLYNRIDIALDPFPCVGGTTSMDTLWMGVPFITLAGHHFSSRMGVSILTNVGLTDLIAHNTDEYINIATNLAQDRKKLRYLRDGLRERALHSPLMDQDSFARNMEAAYRRMWKLWIKNF